jgi:hypothetical protein
LGVTRAIAASRGAGELDDLPDAIESQVHIVLCLAGVMLIMRLCVEDHRSVSSARFMVAPSASA